MFGKKYDDSVSVVMEIHKCALWIMFVYTDLGLRNCFIYIYIYVCVCVRALALYVAWIRNYMRSSTVNKVTKDVDFYRCMHGISECHV